ncbi:hypothetical protein [Streptomyces resistomycificus]|uniref:LigA protein n=1 Tax=Streptomyces resistomycificus TaxID=67356 RepID=A0A0L8KZA3_9ACTN|nr:hypothetical protein [Streptomyces resistomycificus]KOG31277.1 hypothetical protein ADK37_31580 [Streptomyces resistomycificus]KUN93110.1 hypothetical protein AQJ84_31430 [Streptomyces resistomycificus]
MPRTTPPRPLDVTAHFPELAPLARTAVRLHPRPGVPTAADSSIGGPLLWPAREPWPTCPDHTARQYGHAPEDLRHYRRILGGAWDRPREEGADLLTPHERTLVDRLGQARWIPLDGPLPLLPVAQLHASDVPGLPRPDGTDLLQVLWCAFDHGEQMPRAELRWRAATEVVDPLPAGAAPRPPVVERDSYLPEPCVLHPETVTEHPAPHELPEELADRIEAWEEGCGLVYQYDLGVAPGCKVGGHAPWSHTDPFPMSCPECRAAVRPLLTLDSSEWDGGSLSWRPVEDGGHRGPMFRGPAQATRLRIGRDHALQLYVCTTSYGHPHLQNIQ